MEERISGVTLTVKSGGKIFFRTGNIKPGATDSELNSFANAVNSVQHTPLENVFKTVEYLLVP